MPEKQSFKEWQDGHPPERKARRVALRKKLAEAPKPTVEVGSHLTVATWPNGKRTLHWDDDALLRDVRAALQSK